MSKKLDQHAAVLRQLDGSNVDAGWFENAVYPTGQSVAAVMIANEFGTTPNPETGHAGIPARPLLRQSAEKIDTKLPGYIERRSAEILAGTLDVESYKKKLGEALVATIMETLNEGDFVGNADSTIAQKGFDKPLVRDGILGQTITHRETK